MTWNCEWWNSHCPLHPFVRDLAQQIQQFHHCTHIASGKFPKPIFEVMNGVIHTTEKWCIKQKCHDCIIFQWDCISCRLPSRIQNWIWRSTFHSFPLVSTWQKLISQLFHTFWVSAISFGDDKFAFTQCSIRRKVNTDAVSRARSRAHTHTQSGVDMNVWRACTV